MKIKFLVGIFLSLPIAHAWLPTDNGRNLSGFSKSGTDKTRGVNLGSSFIIEKWMATGEWNDMGCGDYNSEWGCVEGIGQDVANKVFKKHWQTSPCKQDLIC